MSHCYCSSPAEAARDRVRGCDRACARAHEGLVRAPALVMSPRVL